MSVPNIFCHSSPAVMGYMTVPKRHYFDAHRLLAQWQQAFPQAKLIVRAFNDTKALPHGVVSDFEALTGLDRLPEDLKKLERRNESMGGWGCEALLLLNTQYADLPEPIQKTLRHWIRNDIKGDGHLRPDPDLAHVFQNNFAKGNAAVIKKYLSHSPHALSPNWTKIEAPTPTALISANQMMALIRKLNSMNIIN